MKGCYDESLLVQMTAMLQVEDSGKPRRTPIGSIEAKCQMKEVHIYLARLCANNLGVIMSFIIKSFEEESRNFLI